MEPAIYRMQPHHCRPDWGIAMQQISIQLTGPRPRCQHCNTPFAPGVIRTNKDYCSVACGVAAREARKTHNKTMRELSANSS